jgi:heme-degrading monooxygenase HmoA
MESPSDWLAEGLLVHATGEGADGFRVVDVWESEDAFREFGKTLMPLLDEMGVTDQPEVYPAHSFVSA